MHVFAEASLPVLAVLSLSAIFVFSRSGHLRELPLQFPVAGHALSLVGVSVIVDPS